MTGTRTVDGMVFGQEPEGVSADGHGLTSFFVRTTLDAVVLAYQKALAEARRLFGARAPGSLFTDAVARGATLHWLYYYAVNDLPLAVAAADWEHPGTWRIIQQIVEATYAPGSLDAIDTCARLMGITAAEYESWRAADELFQMR